MRRLNPRKVASCQVPVIYDRRVASSLLGHLAGCHQRLGHRARHKLPEGQSAAADVRRPPSRSGTIRCAARGLASRPFDGKGLPVRRRAMVENGMLTGWFLDLRSSRQLGLPPTGQAGAGFGGPPSPTSSNLYLEPGKTSRAAR